MAPTEIAGPGEGDGFEFNPMAPEFVPVKSNGVASGGWSNSTPSTSPSIGPTRSRLQTRKATDDSISNAGDGERCRRGSFSSRRSTSALEAPGQVSTLVVKNLPLDLETGAIVRQQLESMGAAPKDVELHLDASGVFRGTAFVRYGSADEAKSALEKLGSCPELGGRKTRVEIQKSKSLIGRRSLEAELPQEELLVVRGEIERFLADDTVSEVGLSANLTVQQRKYAHTLAERHGLVHATKSGSSGEKFVHLSKARRDAQGTARKERALSFQTTSCWETQSHASPVLDALGVARSPVPALFEDPAGAWHKRKVRSAYVGSAPPPFSDEALLLDLDGSAAPGLLPPPALPLPATVPWQSLASTPLLAGALGSPSLAALAGSPQLAALAGSPSLAALAGSPSLAALAGSPSLAAVCPPPGLPAPAKLSPELTASPGPVTLAPPPGLGHPRTATESARAGSKAA
eukprot:TRINITY_DN14228_c0_g2_i1.p1 TRINITY_DN14228_c0_g2~~TRINITY_DN14228_c0_g2_i1.p1  ORF type:complete len:461 (-),score=70.26 TRINITY_DN14228_c0_g2_i1:154-1536(-)